MLAMLRSRLQVLIALFLPLSFLWLMLACVATCESQSKSHTAPEACSSENVATEITTHTSSCPLNALPEATVPERAGSKSKLLATLLNSFSIVPVDVNRGTTLRQSFNALFLDSPIARPPVLRI